MNNQVLLFLALLSKASCMNCDYPEDKPCLNVFEDEPQELPKCYCTKSCPIPLSTLKVNCSSGQLLPDSCSVCLQCAKSRGEVCGGFKNQLGVCGHGLRCLVRFNVPRNSDGREEENSAEGTCVRDDSDLCPLPDVLNLKEGVNCRPGRLGILSEALYCPEVTRQKSSSEPPSPAANEANGPTLIQLILSHVPTPFGFQ